jgi:hypothetical protein
MEEKDFNALVEKMGEKTATLVSEKFDEVVAGLITMDQLAEQTESFAKTEDIKDLSEKLDGVVIDLKKMAEAEKSRKVLTLKEQVAAKHEELKAALTDGDKKGFKMDLDLKTNVTSASITDDSQGVYLPGFNRAAYLGMVFEQYFQKVTLPSNHHGTVYYVDETTTTRNAANTAEATAAPESAIAWTQYSLGMGKILDSIPLTHEAMMDIDQLTAEVEFFINNNIRLHMDSQMWDGNGTLPNWKGIYTYSTDFTQAIATGAGVDAVDGANIYDLIATINTYIANGKESKYDPNVVFMNPRDVLKGQVVKDANDNYIIPPYVSRDGMNVAGTIVVPTAQVTANTLAMGDARHVRFYDVEGISLEFGLDADDFTKDLITLKGRKRGNLLLKTIDATAFYKVTDIDQRITDITA